MHINYFQLKILAIIAMVIDHIAWVWVDTASFMGQSMHFIGRLTAPLMCFLLVEGFFKTSNYNKYIFRMFLFACLAQLPYSAMLKGLDQIADPSHLFFRLNVLFNFLMALLALGVFYKTRFHLIVKTVVLLALLFASFYMDWNIFIIIFSLVFAYYRQDRKQQYIAYMMTAMGLLLLVDVGLVQGLPSLALQWMPLGLLLVPFLLKYCNHEFGSRWGGKYFFYWFYPLHMLLIAVTAWVLNI